MQYNQVVGLCCAAWLVSCNSARLDSDNSTGDLSGLISVRVDPADQTLESTSAQPATFQYKAIGTFSDGDRDITSLTLFHLDNSGVGGFKQAKFQGSSQQGGRAKIIAQAGSLSGNAQLLVHFTAIVKVEPPAGTGTPLPSDPGLSFQGTPTAARAPKVVYPNNGVMMPPNIHDLEVHWLPGAGQNTLFQLSFQSPTASITTYARCGAMVNNGCIFPLDATSYAYLANSNTGGPPVRLTVSGSDDTATGFGQSAELQLQFSQENVEGGLYYWTVSNGTGIMRVDFGASALKPKLFISPGGNGFDKCVGCHAVSRDGTKMVASLGGQGDGRLVYIANLAAPAASLLTLNGSGAASTSNHVQYASFNPDGSRFVSIYGDTDMTPESHTLFMHDGNTGLRLPTESVVLNYEPSHPDWAPNGAAIAVSRVGIHQSSQRPFNCGIEVVNKSGTGWGQSTTVVPIVPGKNRYNPNFAPDSSFVVYSESTCPNGNNTDGECDADSDSSAKTWAVKAQSGAAPVLLLRAAAPGVMDGAQTNLSDTYARFSPFQQRQGSGRLFWVTISSTRKGGLRDPGSNRWLWMFAVDPDKVAAGQDGSYPGFWLPFQDLTTSNHIGQWTQKIVVGPG